MFVGETAFLYFQRSKTIWILKGPYYLWEQYVEPLLSLTAIYMVLKVSDSYI